MTTFIADQDRVTLLDSQHDISFEFNGRVYHTVGIAFHSSAPAGMRQTYRQDLVCHGDDDFEGYLLFDITNPHSEDESDSCNWDNFDVYKL